jgi:hypothetical protein
MAMKLSAVSGVVRGLNYIHVSYLPDAHTPRPVILIPIVKLWASMSDHCLEGMQELIGIEYTRLEMVQYSLKLIISILTANDSMAGVTFSSGSQVVMERTQMTPEGKARGSAILEGLRPGDHTDMWSGVERAMGHRGAAGGSADEPCADVVNGRRADADW